MSQKGIFGDPQHGHLKVEYLEGNSGGPVGPDPSTYVINVVGDSPIVTTGNPGTYTLTIDTDGTLAITYTCDSGIATPSADNLNVFGTTALAGTSPLSTLGAGDTVTVIAQLSQAVAAADATTVGLANFNSAQFTVDADGFVEFSGAGVATTYDCDTGTATPAANILNVVATTAVAGTSPLSTSGAGNTVTVTNQISQALALADATKVGVCNFDSSMFAVDADGFVTLAGGSTGVDSFAVQAGTSPVVPDGAGLVTFNGGTVAAGTTPVQTNGTGANTMELQVQIAQAIASTNATNIGLAAFDSANFTVDANGFVQLDGSTVGETITGDSGGALSPTAGNWNIVGGTSLAGTTPLVTAGAGSSLTINAQISQALASADVTKIGISNFDSTYFTVDADGFVSTSGTGIGETITGDTGGALSPTAGNWNIVGGTSLAGTTPIATSGTGSTLTANVQISQALAAADATKIGLSNFDSSTFAVDADGFVTLTGASSFSWSVETGSSANLVVNTGVFANNAGGVILSLPATAAVGDTFQVVAMDAAGFVVDQQTGQTIQVGSSTTTITTGTITSTGIGDWIEIVCNVANSGFFANVKQGNVTVA